MQSTVVSDARAAITVSPPPPVPKSQDPDSKRAILKRLRLYALIFTAIFLCCEGAARFLVALEPPAMQLPLSLYRKAELARMAPQTRHPGVIFLGNSITYMAVYPELLSARLADADLPVEIRSLASPSNSPMIDLALLKKAVASGFKPQVVFLGSGLEFMREVNNQHRLDVAFKDSYLYRCQLVRPVNLPDQAQCQVEKISYLYRYRGHFKDLLANHLFDMVLKPERSGPRQDWLREDYVHEEISDQGWGPSYKVFSKEAYLNEFVRSSKGQKRVQALKKQLDSPPRYAKKPGIQELVDFCKQQDIQLVLMGMPGYSFPGEQLDQHPNYRKIKDADRQAAMAYLKMHPHVHFLDLSQDDNSIHYYDRGHQNAVGAVAFTERLAESLKSQQELLRGKRP